MIQWLTGFDESALSAHLAAGTTFEDFFADAAAAGFAVELALSAWDLRVYAPGADFLVAVLAPAR